MNNSDSLQQKISELYRTILLREPDRDGIKHWTHQIYSGIETLQSLKEKLMNSDESAIINDFLNGYVITNDGIKLFLNNKDNVLSRDIAFHKVWEPEITTLVKEIIKKDQIVVDVGSNIGYFTTLFSKLVGDSGKVYSFEPAPKNFELLKKNVSFNNLKNVSIYPMAASDASERKNLFLSTWNFGDNRLFEKPRDERDQDRETIEVEAIRLDEITQEKIDFIKIDVQGFELQVINGAKKLFDNNNDLKIIFEFYPHLLKLNGVKPEDLLYQLVKMGYNIYDIGAGNNLINYNIENICKRYSMCSSLDLFCEKQ
ncbi:Protein-L-isoaspartate O-methyltransferase [Marine Group I thaumarchaeote SCGC AAA799-P11]|uniref:Protein-L-isoaspartate O-methyltransferase n=1 Tax=Marine Group I thaumarchaeote SCGC AAA799-P11 TaxID=1502295 RepID=A0A087S2X5_9ARCH|nr:Protein-L-isoaspartate O-methyltransferase [Marine Group I thaumarchaeote SCGC AAA799-P11]